MIIEHGLLGYDENIKTNARNVTLSAQQNDL